MVFHTPPGIGGMGELEFIRRVPMIENNLVIYHGITTFLRIGDISLYDLNNHKVVAIGELKTEDIGEKELQTTVHILSTSPLTNDTDQEEHDAIQQSMSPRIQQRLNRQLDEMRAVLQKDEPASKHDILDAYYVDELNNLSTALGENKFTYQKVGEGLLIVGIKNSKQTLSKRFIQDYKSKITRLPKNLPQHTLEIMDRKSTGNSIHLGSIDFSYLPGATPIFWWPTDIDFIRKIFFHEVMLITLFNPVHFIRKIKKEGCEIEKIKDGRSFKVTKTFGEKRMTFEEFDYYLYLIQNHFMKEEAVVDIIRWLLKKAEHGELTLNSPTKLLIQHHLIG